MNWAMKTKGYNQRSACALAGIDPRVCLSTDVEAAGRHRVARQDEGAGVRTAKVRVSAAPHSAEAKAGR